MRKAVCNGVNASSVERPSTVTTVLPSGLNRQHQAGADRGPIDNDRARAAHAMLAAEMSSGLPQGVAQAIGEMHARFDIDLDGLAVKLERHAHQAPRGCAALRKPRSTSVATRPRR